MLHMGDITKIDGARVPPVNVIIGGSPCQDLSIAGRRAGLAGERSGLFMEQLRIIKEMRYTDAVIKGRVGSAVRPRFMVWENVPGAFSSNKGADFGAVLEETIKVVCEKAPAVPVPKGGWPTSGCLSDMGGRWSVAWRVFDAQFWGVPQRRRRIALVADFGGASAPEILFERKGVSGYSPESGAAWKRIAARAENGALRNDPVLGKPAGFNGYKSVSASIQYSEDLAPTIEATMPPNVICVQGNCIDRADTAGCNGKGWTEGVSYTLNTIDRPAVAMCVPLLDDQGGNQISGDDAARVAPTLRAQMHGNIPAVVQAAGFAWDNGADARGIGFEADRSPTLRAQAIPAVMVIENHPQDSRVKLSEDGIVQTLSGKMGTGGGNTPLVMCGYSQQSFGEYSESDKAAAIKAGHDGNILNLQVVSYQDVTGTLMANTHPGSYTGHDADSDRLIAGWNGWRYIVRRLTPLECERLQGYPDFWTEIGAWQDTGGKWHKESVDSARYKALGNSIAIPPWFYVLQRLTIACGLDNTMASLFDGIGGFPLIWEGLNGKGTCLWASEIEDFPISVTKKHFREEALS